MIHVSRDGKEIGQYSVFEINKSLTAGTLLKTDWAWYEGAAEWVQITEVEGVEIEAENSFNNQLKQFIIQNYSWNSISLKFEEMFQKAK